MDDLKRCPFCGEVPSSGVEFYESCGGEVKLKAIVYCQKCHINRGCVFQATDINPVSFLDYEIAFDKAVKAWNQRLSEKPEPETIACGDCKHYICHDRRCGYWNHGVKPLEWCCHAERREEGGRDEI